MQMSLWRTLALLLLYLRYTYFTPFRAIDALLTLYEHALFSLEMLLCYYMLAWLLLARIRRNEGDFEERNETALQKGILYISKFRISLY